ncbi:MAG: NosD domain-containing protein, partial [Promethearchaeota archaeon]
DGIILDNNCDYNNITDNLIINNNRFGANIATSDCGHNLFYKNNFTNNGVNAIDNSPNNNWDNGSYGNYWSNYSGRDINDDGIGDKPYNWNGVVDNYPIFNDGDWAPFITINYPTNQTKWAVIPTLNISVYDPNFLYLWYNYSNFREFLLPGKEETLRADIWNSIPDETWFTLKIFANDTAGNLNSTFTLTLYKDTSAPKITLVPSVTNYSIINVPPSFKLIISDANFNYSWYTISDIPGKEFLNNNTLESINLTKFWNNLTQGWFTIYFFANDSLGNLNNTFSLLFYKDLSSPIIHIINPEYDKPYSQAPEIQVIAIDVALDYIWYICDGRKEFLENNTVENLLETIWNNLDEGEFTITFYANDSFGYTNSYEYNLIKDTIPPNIEIEKFEIGEIKDIEEVADIYISWNVEDMSDILYFQIKLDDEDWIKLDSEELEYTFKDVDIGDHEITIKAYDSAGLVGTEKYEFNIDYQKPEPFIENSMFLILVFGLAGIIITIIYFFKKSKTTVERNLSLKNKKK